MDLIFTSAKYPSGQSLRNAYAESPKEAHDALLRSLREAVSTLEGRYHLARSVEALLDELEPLYIEKSYFWPAIEKLNKHHPDWLPTGNKKAVVEACCDGRYKEDTDGIENVFYTNGGVRAISFLIRVLDGGDALFPLWRSLRAKTKLVENVAQNRGPAILEEWVNQDHCTPEQSDPTTKPTKLPRLGLHPSRRNRAPEKMNVRKRSKVPPTRQPLLQHLSTAVGLLPQSGSVPKESIMFGGGYNMPQTGSVPKSPPRPSQCSEESIDLWNMFGGGYNMPQTGLVPKSPPRPSQFSEESIDLWNKVGGGYNMPQTGSVPKSPPRPSQCSEESIDLWNMFGGGYNMPQTGSVPKSPPRPSQFSEESIDLWNIVGGDFNMVAGGFNMPQTGSIPKSQPRPSQLSEESIQLWNMLG